MRKPFRNGIYWLVGVTALLITVTGIVYQQKWYRILPLYISLFVMLMQTKANRYNFLLGSLNSVLYAIVGFSLKLYGSGCSALFMSFPLQMLTFISWNKKSYGNSAELKRLSNKARVLGLLLCLCIWLILYFILSGLGSGYIILDNTVTVIGFISTFLSLTRHIEYPFTQVVGSVISLILYINITKEVPGQITYVIYTLYSLICCIISLRFMTRLYKKQQSEK